MRFAVVLAGLVLVSALAFAADVDGTWQGVINVTGSEVPVSWTFKADGDKLTGGVSQAGGPEIPLKNGKIDGDNFSFLLSLEFQGQPMDINYKGVIVSDSEIKLTGEVMGQTFEYVVKKVK
jgi:hypothetical protein